MVALRSDGDRSCLVLRRFGKGAIIDNVVGGAHPPMDGCAVEHDRHHDEDADTTKGFKTFAPVPAKSTALRVTTVRS